MPRLVNRNPSYRHHKPSGRAVVTLNGDDVYLGTYGSAASRREYDRVIAEWLARGRQVATEEQDARINDIIKGYWEFAERYYADSGPGELDSIRLALSILRRNYGTSPARNFGPLALQVVREKMIEAGWSRGYINAQVGRLKRCFKWACSRELIPASVFHGLQAVDGLRQGKTEAREADPVKPVPELWVNLILPHLSRQVAGMVRLQLASGMRPGEVCVMRGCDVDTSGAVWVYKPQKHKNAHRGHDRLVYLGPNAQEVVKEFLKTGTQAYLFSPIDAESERLAALAEARKTPLSCGNRPGSNRKRQPERVLNERYDVASYRRAIARACDEAFPPPDGLARIRVKANGRKKNASRRETLEEWRARLGEKKWAQLEQWRADHRWHPHQLRHTTATRLRKEYGLEAARVVLGHRSAAVAEIYAEIDHDKGVSAASLSGNIPRNAPERVLPLTASEHAR